MPEKDPPIVERDYIVGVTVVDIGDVRVARGMSRRPHSACNHMDVTYDPQERRIWCKDCETNIDAFDAFVLLVGWHDAAVKNISKRKKALEEAERHAIRSRAAKKIDEAWRHKNLVPCCPHCREGLLPEDVLSKSLGMASKQLIEARRNKRKATP